MTKAAAQPDAPAGAFKGLTLLVPALPGWHDGPVVQAWRRHGGRVQPVDRFWRSPVERHPALRLYGPDLFCHTLATRLGLRLAAPRDELLAHLPPRLLGRRVRLDTLGGLVHQRRRRCFVKPVEPKLFRSQVTTDPTRILARYSATRHNTPVLVADVVAFEAEVRVFVLDDEIATAATYRGTAVPAEALAIVRELLPFPPMPRAWAVDVGRLSSGAWAVIEFNAVHAASAYGCDPMAVAHCIAVNAAAVEGG